MAKIEGKDTRNSKTLNPVSLHSGAEKPGEESTSRFRLPGMKGSKGGKTEKEGTSSGNSETRRRHLADLLWGHKSVPKRETEEPIRPVRLDQEQGPSASDEVRRLPGASLEEMLGRRISQRRQCSFPGLIRVLLPELSFQPKVLAVRVVDISPSGARLETRQLTAELADAISNEKRFARLEALVPSGKQILPGSVRWAEYGEEISHIGLRFEQEYTSVDDLFTRGLEETKVDTHPLMSPRLAAFPSMTSKQHFNFRGTAPGALEVEVQGNGKTWLAPVEGDTFEVEVPIAPESSNFFSFASLRESMRSIPTPICIIHRMGVRDTNSINAGSLVQDISVDEATQRLTMELSGGPRRFFQALRTLEKMLQHSDHIEMRIEMTGDVAKAAKVLKVLQEDPR